MQGERFLIDGLEDASYVIIAGETFGVERVEVLKGPASVLYGRADPGSPNMVVAPLAAGAGALMAASLIAALAWRRGIEPTRLLLVGIALGALITAVTSVLFLRWQPWAFFFVARGFTG